MMGGPRRREGGARRSGSRALIFWTVALLAGGAAAMMLRWYVERGSHPSTVPLASVVVAANDLPVATTLRLEHLRLPRWAPKPPPQRALCDPKGLGGRVVP